MKIAVTGATGFIGRYIVEQLVENGHQLKCWFRDPAKIETCSRHDQCEWSEGGLGDDHSTGQLVEDCEAVVHSALWKPGATFRGGEGDIVEFCEKNIIGTLKLIERAWTSGVRRFIFVSTCAVHEKILDDRKLDEAHPLWPLSHYGAHKAALEKFVHSYGFGKEMEICAIRPTGVYGLNLPASSSKWYSLVKQISNGEPVSVEGGGKEIHAADVARGIEVLLNAPANRIIGECFNCYDKYISKFEVATIAKAISGSDSEISGQAKTPKHQIDTSKIRELGMEFGGTELLRETIDQMIRN